MRQQSYPPELAGSGLRGLVVLRLLVVLALAFALGLALLALALGGSRVRSVSKVQSGKTGPAPGRCEHLKDLGGEIIGSGLEKNIAQSSSEGAFSQCSG